MTTLDSYITPRLRRAPSLFAPWLLVLASVCGAVTYAVSSAIPVDQALYHVLGISAPAALVAGILTHRPEARFAWLLIAAGVTCTASGDLYWDIVGWLGGTPAFPGPADAIYLTGYLLFGTGLFVIGRRAVAPRGRELLDGGVLGASIVLVLFTTLIAEAMDQPGPLLTRLTAAAYPSVDAVLLIAIIPLVLRRPRNPSVLLLVTFALLTFTADLIYGLEELHGVYAPGGWLDTLWLVSFGVLGAAGLHPSMRAAAAPLSRTAWDGRGRFITVAGAVVVVACVLASLSPSWDDNYLVGIALSAVVLALIFCRVALVAVEQQAAQRALQREAARLAAVEEAQREVAGDVRDLDAALASICRRTAELTGAGGVVVATTEEGRLRVRITVGVTVLGPGDWISENSLSAIAVMEDRVVVAADASADPRVDAALSRRDAARSIAAAPIHYGGAPVGAVVLLAPSPAAFDDHDTATLQLMASLVSVAVNRNHDFAARIAVDAIVDSTNDAIVRRSLDGTIVTWNRGAEELYGYAADDMIGQSIELLLPPESIDELARQSADVTSSGSSVAYETERVRRDGRRIAVAVIASPIKDVHRRIVGITTIARDITSRCELEEQLNQAQKLEAIGRLSGGVAHDFNNLLLAIGGYASFITSDPQATESILHSATEIEGACTRAAELTNQLLAYSRRQVLKPRSIDPNEVIDETRRMLDRLVGEDVEIVCRLSPHVASIVADPGRLSQVVMNLGVNARDAMPDGGRLTIETSLVTLTPREAAALGADEGLYVCLSVGDTGVGMDTETQDHIFEPFFTTKEEGRGTGLGLSTVYGTIRQSGGYVSVDSERGVGTTFKIYLPAAATASAKADGDAARIAPSALDAGGRTVLLVEDQEAVRQVVAEMLSSAGYDVFAAAGGAEALDWARTADHVDVLISDVVMPGMKGPALAHAFRAVHPEARVIFTSGYTDETTLDAAREPATFLQKPFTAAELLTALEHAGAAERSVRDDANRSLAGSV